MDTTSWVEATVWYDNAAWDDKRATFTVAQPLRQHTHTHITHKQWQQIGWGDTAAASTPQVHCTFHAQHTLSFEDSKGKKKRTYTNIQQITNTYRRNDEVRGHKKEKRKRDSQYLQIAKGSEGSIFNAADVVAVQLPADERQESAVGLQTSGWGLREGHEGRGEEGGGTRGGVEWSGVGGARGRGVQAGARHSSTHTRHTQSFHLYGPPSHGQGPND